MISRPVISFALALAGFPSPGSAAPSGFERVNPPASIDAAGIWWRYDSKPSFLAEADGPGWAVWQSYVRGTEAIQARRLGAGEDSAVIDISAPGGLHSRPVVAGDGAGGVWFCWIANRGEDWQVRARRWTGGTLGPPETLSPVGVDATQVAAGRGPGGRLAVAWSGFAGRVSRIAWTERQGGGWSPPEFLSPESEQGFRPALAFDRDDAVRIVWDAHDGHRYVVRGIVPGEAAAGPVTISAAAENCLKPAVAWSDREGWVVAWLRVVDVMSAAGIIEQLNYLQAAAWRDGSWQPLPDDSGGDPAELAQGLTAQVEPDFLPTAGYLGRRRQPMLAPGPDGLWLLWERKSVQVGSTAVVRGDLAGRRLVDGRWGPRQLLAQGWLDYRLAAPDRAAAGRLELIASEMPVQGRLLHQSRRSYWRFTLDPNEARSLAEARWMGWRPIDWTHEADDTSPRTSVDVDGRTFRLHWIDTHVHSVLSPDPEGEPDELIFYARDRARIDAMVLQENDFYLVPLTGSEHALGALLANRLSEPGHFVVLRGYEWTQRVPRVPGPPGDLRLERSATGRNHRTVIYLPSGGPLVRHAESHNDVRALYDAVGRSGGILVTQHQDWVLGGTPIEVAVEVASGWANHMRSREFKEGYLHPALDAGHRFGLAAASDTHRRVPGLGGGLTGLYLDELTPEAIFRAYRERRMFATSGTKVALWATIDGRPMGQESRTAAAPRLRLKVEAPRRIVAAALVRDGREIGSWSPAEGPASQLRVDFVDRNLAPGSHWYYWEVLLDGDEPQFRSNDAVARGNMAWSSPLWVDYRP